ncbi:YcgL domain-containing protein [Gallaecimonas xiamenensis]|uniref:YcgL domain-containing protein B3C1_15784 n=1 Tax=Gallaecimonas xiamenensis 3-C-1 TaxID=745411 RepID=K2JEU9_9GAMM|nr:YcgL domain-containing protein [Gallaecimonas xiamenensis]EKE69124.1 hypothetical protein B3C1_15784 [Gallaecimonas xiamenensis 3-C-1]
MLCAVYKSVRKSETYLYIPKRDDFSQVPEDLLAVFGTPVFVTQLLLKDRQLARMSSSEMQAILDEKGYYLQLPPPPEDLLKAHKTAQGASS